jgi:adenine specific DNA methylase Mod
MDGCSILGRHKIQDGENFETKISEETHNVILVYIKELVDFINNNQELLQEIQVDNTIYANYKSLNEILLPLK